MVGGGGGQSFTILEKSLIIEQKGVILCLGMALNEFFSGT